MKILYYTSSLSHSLGGAEQYCIRVAKEFQERGHEVLIVTTWLDEPAAEYLVSAGLDFVCLPSPQRTSSPAVRSKGVSRLINHFVDFRFALKPNRELQDLVSRFDPDVTHIHRWQGVGSGILDVSARRVVHTVHDFCLLDPNATTIRPKPGYITRVLLKFRQRCSQALMNRSAVVSIFPSQRTLELHQAQLRYRSKDAVRVLPHGWALDVTVADRSRGDDTLVFLYMGKLSAEKGVRTLLEAWGSGISGARLSVAGAGPESPAVQAAAARDWGVEYLGWLEGSEKSRALADSDILVLPSQWPENFPLVVAEALLAGLPVVSNRVASPPLVRHEENGYLVTDCSAAALRDALEALASDRVVVNRLSQAAKIRATDLDMGVHYDRLVSVYRPTAES